jgi:MoaA/NifB/PqqE/SkfB family radical SAM enzyme
LNFLKNESFCALAWMHIAAAPNGDIRPCCISTDTINKLDGTPFNLGYDSLKDILNSDSYKDLRNNMIEGNPIQGCKSCYTSEKNSNLSYRKHYNIKWAKLLNTKITNKIEIPETVEYFDLRFGNLCNLKCKSCSPENSTQYEKELIELKENDSNIESFIRIEPISNINDWYNTDMFFKNIESQIENIQELYITGGEPSIIEKNYEILEYIIKQNKAKDISLKLNSNMTNVQDRFLNIISQFKQVSFYASIDGFGSIQEYIRYPSNWEQIDKNFKKLISERRPNVSICVTPVIQNVNLGYITELFDYLENFNKEYNQSLVHILPIILYGPEQLDLSYLPLEYKTQCWNKIQEWMTNNNKFQQRWFYDKMIELKNKCLTDTPYENVLNRFKEFTEIFDNHRGVSLKDVNPELYNIVNK